MTEINRQGFNPATDIKTQPTFSNANVANNEEKRVEFNQQADASSPASEALGRSMIEVDNHDADMQRLLENPELANVSDSMYNAAIKAGASYPEAATFATAETM